MPKQPASAKNPPFSPPILIALALIGLTLTVYWPVVSFEFLNFDDPLYVTDNPYVLRGLSWKNIEWAFTTFSASNWHPLTWLSHMLDCQLFAQRAGPAHLVNLAFHLANTVLLFLFLNRTTRALWCSALVAALFALHPLHVESVAWIAERKDVLSACFFFLALLSYARYVAGSKVQSLKSEASNVKSAALDRLSGASSLPSRVTHHASQITSYLLALLFVTLGLLAKPMLVTFPFTLLLLDYWPFQRFRRDQTLQHAITPTFHPSLAAPSAAPLLLILEKLPFLLLSAASSVITFIAQQRGGSVATAENFPFLYHLPNALLAYATYLKKMVWPAGLACFYPLHLGSSAWPIALAAALLVALSALAWRTRRRLPWFIVGWLWYLGMLVPVIGLVQVGTQFIADRYTYLPFVGLFIAIIWSLDHLFEHFSLRRTAAVPTAAATTATSAHRHFILARCVLASAVLLACALATPHQLKYWRNSEALFTHAVEVCPDASMSHLDLGHARLMQGRFDEAIPEFQETLRLAPNYALAEFDWAHALRLQGKLNEAVSHYLTAIELQTNYPEAHYFCANVLTMQGNFAEAERHYLQALRQKPKYPQAHNNLGNLYEVTGQITRAVAEYSKAIELDPEYAEGHYYLGGALARQRKMHEAIEQFRAAINLDGSYALALNDLAWSLATAEPLELRNLPQAIQLAERACRVTKEKDIGCLDTLATIYAQAGRFPAAAKTASNAIVLARKSGQNDEAAKLESQFALYRNNQAPPPIPAARTPLSTP